MIRIRYMDRETDEEITIEASGLGDLGWQLDCMGCDTASSDEDFLVVSMEIL